MSLPARLVCGRCFSDADQPFAIGTATRAGLCSRCNGQGVWLLDGEVDRPRLRDRRKSEVFSTSCALLRTPTIIWDVNGYYAALGVRPDATRAELRRAYMALGGEKDARLTYILSRLLDPEVRRRYDSCALGDVFMDLYVMERLMNEARQRAAEAVAAGDVESEDLADLGGWAEMLDLSSSEVDRASRKDDDELASRQWGYFLWRSARTDDESLDLWQHLLTGAFWSSGIVREVGIGFSRDQGPWTIQKVGETTVIFIDEDEVPTAKLAREVVSSIRTKESRPIP